MATVRRIAVVGAGLAGLACALAASLAGAAVEVFEAAAAPADPPAHVDLVPNLWRDLVALGVGNDCLREGFAYQGTALADGEGTPTIVWATPALAGPRWPAAVGMRCGRLMRVLADAARSHGVQFHWGRRVASVDEARAALRLDDGDEHRADLVLLATGRDDRLLRHGPVPALRRPRRITGGTRCCRARRGWNVRPGSSRPAAASCSWCRWPAIWRACRSRSRHRCRRGPRTVPPRCAARWPHRARPHARWPIA